MQSSTELKAAIEEELCRRDYAFWYKRSIPDSFGFPRHIEYLCQIVQGLIDGDYQRVAISLPPGHAKSSTVTHRLPVYWGQFRPKKESIVVTGYSQRFAEKNLSAPAREIAQEMGYLGTASALDEWHFKNGSRVLARGVGNPPTGINPITLAGIDDPISSRAEASSEVQRQAVWDWFAGSIVQRFWPETRALVIATRWHEDDLIGRLKESDTAHLWRFINLPAIAEDNDPIGREPGEALWPEAKPLEFLEQVRREMGDYEFEALYQGNPTPREGALFQIGKISLVSPCDVPDVASALAFDLGSTVAGDSTAAAQCWICPVSGRIYLDFADCQLEPYERNVWMKSQADIRKPKKVRGPQDPGAAGKEVAQNFVRLMAGFAVHTETVKGDKVYRAEPLAAQMNAGMVCFLDTPTNRRAMEQFRQFPNGKHDDFIDAGVDAWVEARRMGSFKGGVRKGSWV